MSKHYSDRRVHEIIANTLKRRESGEPLSDEDVLAAHPDLADRLAEKLKQLALVAKARELADVESIEATKSFFASDRKGNSGPRNQSEGVRTGQKIRHYILEEQIGAGGFGSVWRARDLKLDCEVAVKIPRRELSPEDTQQFIHEARVSAQLRKHPNIVSVHEADWEAGTAFIVSDYVDGDSLDDRLDRSRVPFNDTVDLLTTVCDALDHAHQEGIIHRDLKPDNILLDASGTPHITDFGLAKRESQVAAAESSRIMGTAAYMSPEQARGDSDRADSRSDVFSLGVVLFELLTGERPFRGSVSHILRRISSDDPPRPRSFDSRIPADLETICLKCLEKDPARRYQSARELSEDLQRFRRREPVEARPVSAAGRLLRWSQRNPSILLLSLSLMVVTMFATWAAFRLIQAEVREMQEELNRHAEESLNFPAAVADEVAMLNLTLRFDQVSSMVEAFRNNQQVLQHLVEWNEKDAPSYQEILSLYRKSWAIPPPPIRPIQAFLGDLDRYTSENVRERTYSFFVCDAEGHQIARSPPESTLGTKFDYRPYFRGEVEWRKWGPKPRLSDSFKSVKDKWVIAVSAPIWDGDDFLGVAGIFIELGYLINNFEFFSSNEAERSLSVFDVRHRQRDATRIHYQPFDQRAAVTRPDDLSKIKPDFPATYSPASMNTIYEGQWRIVIRPITLPDEYQEAPGGTDGELYVMLIEKATTIEDPGSRLRANLVTIGLSVVGFAALVLTIIWIIILQRVIKT